MNDFTELHLWLMLPLSDVEDQVVVASGDRRAVHGRSLAIDTGGRSSCRSYSDCSLYADPMTGQRGYMVGIWFT